MNTFINNIFFKLIERLNLNKKKLLLLIYIFNVIFLLFLPLIFGWEILTTNNAIGKFIDFNVPENIEAAKRLALWSTSTWSDSINGGYRNTFASTIILQNFILYGPIFFFESTLLLGKWNVIMPLSVNGVSYFIFFTYFIKYYRRHYYYFMPKQILLESLLLSILFTFNNFTFNEIHYGSSNYVFSTAIMPAAIALFHKACIENKIGITTIASLIITCISGGILQNLVILILFYAILTYFNRFNLKYILKYILIYCILSIYWILPLLLGVTDTLKNDLARPYLPSMYSIFDVLSNRIYSTLGGRAHYEYAMTKEVRLAYWIFSFIFLLLPIYSVIKLFSFKRRKYASEINMIILALFLSIIMLKGSGPPFADFNNFIYSNFTLSSLFRTTNRIWPIYYICLAFLYSVAFIGRHRISILIILIIIICNPWYITQDYGTNALLKSQPNEPHLNFYKNSSLPNKLHEIINENENFKILTKPMNYSVRFLDKGGLPNSQGGDSDLLFGGKGFFSTDNPTITSDFLISLEYQMYTNSNFLIENVNLFRGLGIKYFINRKNIKAEFSPNLYYADNFTKYDVQDDIVIKVFSDNDIDVYKFVTYLPIIYTVNNIEELSNLKNTSNNHIKIKYDKFLIPDKLISGNWQNNNIFYTKKSDSIYQIKAVGISETFPVFLNVNFNEDWILLPNLINLRLPFIMKFASFNNEDVFHHFRGPMLNNGWIINSEYVCEIVMNCEGDSNGISNFDGFIIFKPQLFLLIGGLFSFSILVILFLTILLKKIFDYDKIKF